jgi:iron complex transport system ATP-binding protein
MTFRAKELGFAYGLHKVTFELPPNGFVAVVGPNGAGKSTLVGILAGLRAPYHGCCEYDGREVTQWSRREFARKVAFLPQALRLEFPFTGEEVAFMGRAPYVRGWYASPQDRVAVERALQLTDAVAFRHRDIRSLSGGERQRVMLAAALAQEPQALLLDEPATFLDLKHQLGIYRLLAELGKEILVVAVTHDLNLALQFAQHILVLDQGSLAAQGKPVEILAPSLLKSVFEVDAHLLTGEHGSWLRFDADAI